MRARAKILTSVTIPLILWASGCGLFKTDDSGAGGGGGDTCVPEDDGNPCTDDVCKGGVTTHAAKDAGAPCLNGWVCDGGGECIECLSPEGCGQPLPVCHGETGYPGTPMYPVLDTPLPGSLVDLNGDGLLDLTFNNGLHVSMMPGLPGGGLGPPVDFDGPAMLLALDDLNADGSPDLVGTFGPSLRVYTNHGDGTFAPFVEYAIDEYGEAVVVGDMNGDGAPDVVVVSEVFGVNSTIQILWNDGNGGLSGPDKYDSGSMYVYPRGMVAGDFNEDGALDLALSDIQNGTVRVYFNQGDGKLLPPWDYPQGGSPEKIFAKDFDKDGHLDLMVGLGSDFAVWTNAGDGTFGSVKKDDMGGVDLLVDMKGDGIDDIVYAERFEAKVSVRLGDGTWFGAPQTYQVGHELTGVMAADVNGDGRGDLVLPLQGTIDGGNGIDVRLARADGTFEQSSESDVLAGSSSMAAGDLDGDGTDDLVITSGTGADGGLLVRFSDWNESLGAPPAAPMVGNPTSVALADVTGDGAKDIVLGYKGTLLRVAKALDTGAFDAPFDIPAGDSNRAVAVGDLNGDGDVDIVTAGAGTVTVVRNQKHSMFDPPKSYATTTGDTPSLSLADMNDDGRLDIVVAGGTVNILWGLTDGSFELQETSVAGVYGASIATGDLDGDGLLDIVVPRANLGDIGVLHNGGDGTFAATFVPVLAHPAGVAGVDLDNDGDLDLVVSHDLLARVSVLRNDGSGGLSAPAVFAAGMPGGSNPSGYSPFVVAHLDHDGLPDIARIDLGYDRLTILPSSCHE